MQKMPAIDAEIATELELLASYDLHTIQGGVKVRHDAPASLVKAAVRLHEKGLVTVPDGGFLTDLGIEIAEHLQHVLTALRRA
jgi:uncharacterized protein (TIGR02647 family)